jgi:hypothetical protein
MIYYLQTVAKKGINELFNNLAVTHKFSLSTLRIQHQPLGSEQSSIPHTSAPSVHRTEEGHFRVILI